MRPFYHPPLEEITVEGIIYALSDPVRVQIFSQLASAECAKSCTTFTHVKETPLPKSTLSQHFRILREAGLIQSERKGVELHNKTRCSELKDSLGPMIQAIIQAYSDQHQSRKEKK
jgi:DNA-binding transcriptional ArsR family regulator